MAEIDSPPKAGSEVDNLVNQLYFGTAERSVAESSRVPESQIQPFDPDDLFQKRGDYSIYEEMLHDDQVNVSLRLKKDLILGSGFDIVTEDASQEEMKNDLEQAFYEDTESPFEDLLEEMMSAFEFGFSLTEKIFKKRLDGSLTFKTMKTRHPASWRIITDKHGNIVSYNQSTGSFTQELKIPPKSLIHYTVNRKWQNPYGRSDLRSAYQAYFTKRQIIRFYSIFLEKYASPIPVGRYEKNAPQAAKDKLLDALKRFQAKTALVIPKDIEMEFLQSSNKGDAYTKGIDMFNMFIGRSLMIPDLMGFQGGNTSGGSYSLGQDQMDIFFKHIDRRRRTIESLINTHIVKTLITFNWGFQENFPKFKFRPVKDENAQELARIWLEAVKGRAYRPSDEEINHFRKLVKFPEGEVERASEPAAPPFAQGQQSPFQEEGPEEKPTIGEMPDAPEADDEDDKKDKQTFAVFKNPEGDFHKRTDFKAIGRAMDANVSKIMDEMIPLTDEIWEDIFDQIQKKKILEKKDLSKVDTIKVRNLAKVKKVLKKNLRDRFNDAQLNASKEILKSDFAKPVISDEFLAILDEETFQFVGDYEFAINKRVRTELAGAIKDGKPLSSVIGILSDEGKKLSKTQAERYARTKSTEVTNRGRVEFFDESGVVSGYQYSAILDDRTTPICSGLHGKIFKAGEQPIPPMHFNCRSTLIPLTKFEEFKPDNKVGSKNINQFIDDNKGKGFPKQ